jgi:tetratricopeptide (TPR) repeat protein
VVQILRFAQDDSAESFSAPSALRVSPLSNYRFGIAMKTGGSYREIFRKACRHFGALMRVHLAMFLTAAAATGAAAQSVQYRSPSGVEFRAQTDTGPIARAQAALNADPRNVQKFIDLGVAQAGAQQFREAIETFTKGLAVAPNDPMLYRWRGHRYISTVQLDRALADLTRGLALDTTNYGILYHLGIVRFARGEFSLAANMFSRAIKNPPNAGELGGSTDWLWMSLSRAGRKQEAQALLDRRPDSLPNTNAYATRLKLYRGEIGPDAVITPADTAKLQISTLSFGVANWYLARGDTARARAWFQRSVDAKGWPGFAYILSEIELARLSKP